MCPTLATRRNIKIDISQTNEIAKIAKDFEWFSRRTDLKQDIIPEILVKYRKHNNSDTSLNTNQIATDHANIVCRNLKSRFNIDAPFELGQLLNPHISGVTISNDMYRNCLDILNSNKDLIISFCGEKLYNLKMHQIISKKIILKN